MELCILVEYSYEKLSVKKSRVDKIIELQKQLLKQSKENTHNFQLYYLFESSKIIKCTLYQLIIYLLQSSLFTYL